MNKCIHSGRLTADPKVTYSNGANGSTAIASWSLAVERKFKREGEQTADFLNFKAFGKLGEHVEKYWHKGMKMDVVSHCQTGSYTNKDGVKVYTTDFIADEIEFAESKNANASTDNGFAPSANDLPINNGPAPMPAMDMGFMNIPEGYENDLPFGSPTR